MDKSSDALQKVPTADAADNVHIRDVIGNKTDTIGGNSLFSQDLIISENLLTVDGKADTIISAQDIATYNLARAVSTSAVVMSNALTIFTISGGPILIEALLAVCVTNNDNTASTLQYTNTPDVGDATTFSGASSQLTGALAGSSVILQGKTLSTSPIVNISGAGITELGSIGIILQPGTINLVIGGGSTTGTWSHYIRYRPLAVGVLVTGAF